MQDFLWKGYTTEKWLHPRLKGFFGQNTSYLRKPPQITSCGGSAYPLHLSPWYTLDHNYFIEAPGQVGNLGMSRLQAVVNVGRDRSNEIKPNHIKCRVLVGGKNRQCWLNRNPHMASRSESNPDHIDERNVLFPVRQPWFPLVSFSDRSRSKTREIFEARWLLINLYKFLVVF